MNMFMRFQAAHLSVSWSQDFESSMFCRERQSDRSDFNHYHRCGLTTVLSRRPVAHNAWISLPPARRQAYSFARYLQHSHKNRNHHKFLPLNFLQNRTGRGNIAFETVIASVENPLRIHSRTN